MTRRLLVLGTFTVFFLSAQDRKAVGKVTLSSGKVEGFAFLDKPYPRDRFEFCNDIAELSALKSESEARSVAASEVKAINFLEATPSEQAAITKTKRWVRKARITLKEGAPREVLMLTNITVHGMDGQKWQVSPKNRVSMIEFYQAYFQNSHPSVLFHNG